LFFESSFVGYLLGQHFDCEFHVLNLAVDSKYQKRGFGHYLFSQSIYELWKKGVKTCFLEVRPSNTAALSLYKKLGFKTIAVRKRYYQDNLEDALVLTLELGTYKDSIYMPHYADKFTNKFDLFWLKR
jgi:ribosomal-protein-alanine N-acetyltransferase